MKTDEVLPRFELGSLDSESRVLTITPQGRCVRGVVKCGLDVAREMWDSNLILTLIKRYSVSVTLHLNTNRVLVYLNK